MKTECIIIGAGVIGLACARYFALMGKEVIVLESADTFGTEISSRNSEVIHSGIYYPKDSLKAQLCVSGKTQLYQYCLKNGIAHRRMGKLIVATSSEISALKIIQNRAKENGVQDLEYLSAKEIKTYEPSIQAEAALFSPSTGIIDSHGLMLALLGDAETAGAMLAVRSQVISGRVESNGIKLRVQGSDEQHTEIFAKMVVNASGIAAPKVAASIQGLSQKFIPRAYYCKGTYFTLSIPSPFKHLIYPVPNSAGLGVHLTLDMMGQARFGPDTEWVDSPDYQIDIRRSGLFYEAIRRYWPKLPDDVLQPGYAGVRPKIVDAGQAAADFMIQGPKMHGIRGLVNLFGIESPGLTASLAIAENAFKALLL